MKEFVLPRCFSIGMSHRRLPVHSGPTPGSRSQCSEPAFLQTERVFAFFDLHHLSGVCLCVCVSVCVCVCVCPVLPAGTFAGYKGGRRHPLRPPLAPPQAPPLSQGHYVCGLPWAFCGLCGQFEPQHSLGLAL